MTYFEDEKLARDNSKHVKCCGCLPSYTCLKILAWIQIIRMTFQIVSIQASITNNTNPLDWIYNLINDLAYIALAQFQERLF
jgi:hypothetical protein